MDGASRSAALRTRPPPSALAALRAFCDAAKREIATVELTRKVERYLRRVQLDPELEFGEERAEAR